MTSNADGGGGRRPTWVWLLGLLPLAVLVGALARDPEPAPAPSGGTTTEAVVPADPAPTEAPAAPPATGQPAAPQPTAVQPVVPAVPQPAVPAVPQPAVPQPPPETEESPEPAPAAYYRSCAEARAAGAAPIRRGQPGYRAGLDRDGDGVACDT